jgi:propanol-preferring alcohol dehydrogenase
VERRNAQDGVELLKPASEIPIRTQTEPFPLRQANEALRRLKSDEIQGAAVLEVEAGA